jgi:hypothetical protein
MTKGRKAEGALAPNVSRHAGVAAFLALMIVGGSAQSAFAQQSCQEDFKKLSDKRMEQIAALNKLGKANKGKMDPIAACPLARRLASTEGEMFNYMEKNKDWCAIPAQMIESFKQARAKTAGFASQACAFAAKVKKMQSEQEASGGLGQAQKLPSGPL